jgi:hypothetical protein
MLRFTGGFGWATVHEHTSSDLSNAIFGGPDVDYSGFALNLAFDVGGSPIENLAIHARLALNAILNPNLHAGGQNLGSTDNSDITGFLFAPAVSYYFMPANVYVTLAPGLSWIYFGYTDDNGVVHGTSRGPGFGMNADVGKEWWINHELVGLGAAARFWYSEVRVSESGADLALDMFGFALLFSMTYR